MTRQEIRQSLIMSSSRLAVALTVYGEARGETPAAQEAVIWVIRNRAQKRNQTLQAVCFQPSQFSCWWEDNANSQTLYTMAEAMVHPGIQAPTDKTWIDIVLAVNKVMGGMIPDPVEGSENYVTTALYESDACPPWAKRLTRVKAIGHHTFLRSRT